MSYQSYALLSFFFRACAPNAVALQARTVAPHAPPRPRHIPIGEPPRSLGPVPQGAPSTFESQRRLRMPAKPRALDRVTKRCGWTRDARHQHHPAHTAVAVVCPGITASDSGIRAQPKVRCVRWGEANRVCKNNMMVTPYRCRLPGTLTPPRTPHARSPEPTRDHRPQHHSEMQVLSPAGSTARDSCVLVLVLPVLASRGCSHARRNIHCRFSKHRGAPRQDRREPERPVSSRPP